jgi:hypothetical protein
VLPICHAVRAMAGGGRRGTQRLARSQRGVSGYRGRNSVDHTPHHSKQWASCETRSAVIVVSTRRRSFARAKSERRQEALPRGAVFSFGGHTGALESLQIANAGEPGLLRKGARRARVVAHRMTRSGSAARRVWQSFAALLVRESRSAVARVAQNCHRYVTLAGLFLRGCEHQADSTSHFPAHA